MYILPGIYCRMGHKFSTQIVSARFNNNQSENWAGCSNGNASRIDSNRRGDGFKWPNATLNAARQLPFS